MTPQQLAAALGNRYVVEEHRHGLAILTQAFPSALSEICDALSEFRVSRTEVDAAGGNKSTIAARLDAFFVARDWQELQVDLRRLLVLTTRRKRARAMAGAEEARTENRDLDTRTHYIDCYKQGVAIDVEWNNKDTFFARDLGAFRMLHELGLLSVGVLMTRGPSLQTMLVSFGKEYRQKYGATTTHWQVLRRYVEAGTAGTCPLVLIGIEPGAFIDDRKPSRAGRK